MTVNVCELRVEEESGNRRWASTVTGGTCYKL